MNVVKQLIREFGERDQKSAMIRGPYIDLPATSVKKNSFDAYKYIAEIAKGLQNAIREWMSSVPPEALRDYEKLIVRGAMTSSFSNAGPAAYQVEVTFKYHTSTLFVFQVLEAKVVFQTYEGNVVGRKIAYQPAMYASEYSIDAIGTVIMNEMISAISDAAKQHKVSVEDIYS